MWGGSQLEQAEMTARVHQTRRVLEALLLSWKPGSCLGRLTRVVSEGSVPIESRSPVTMKDRMGQLVVGSTIIASFVPDPDGPEVTVNQPVIRRLIACSQLSANACSRCDPISPSVWLRSVERPRDAPSTGLNIRIPSRIPMKGRGFINQGSTLPGTLSECWG